MFLADISADSDILGQGYQPPIPILIFSLSQYSGNIRSKGRYRPLFQYLADTKIADTDIADTDIAYTDIANTDIADTDIADGDIAISVSAVLVLVLSKFNSILCGLY